MTARPRRAPRAAAVRRPAEPVPAIASVAVGALALALYLWLAPRVTGDQDASELTLALATGGVPPPSGYPIYTPLGPPFCAPVPRTRAPWSAAAHPRRPLR